MSAVGVLRSAAVRGILLSSQLRVDSLHSVLPLLNIIIFWAARDRSHHGTWSPNHHLMEIYSTTQERPELGPNIWSAISLKLPTRCYLTDSPTVRVSAGASMSCRCHCLSLRLNLTLPETHICRIPLTQLWEWCVAFRRHREIRPQP